MNRTAEFMGRSRFHSILLVSAILLLCFSHGFGRKLKQTHFHMEEKAADVQFEVLLGSKDLGFGKNFSRVFVSLAQENTEVVSREMIELDYVEAGPNTNTRSGFVTPPPEG